MLSLTWQTMGSVSSLINGSSPNSKHCKASQHRLKERTNHHRNRSGCNLDGLLKCGFTQGSSSSAHPTKNISHSQSGRSEDFFYIKVSQKPRSAYNREKILEDQMSRGGESDGRLQPKLPLISGKMTEKTSAEKSSVRSTALTRINPSRTSSADTGRSSQDHICLDLCPLKKASSPNTGNKKGTSGTVSDSGRNSMSSLPTHSTSGSLSASTGPVSHSNGSSALTNSLSKGVQPNFSPWVNGNGTNLDGGYRAGLNSSESASKTNEDAGSHLAADEANPLCETAGGIRLPITTDESLIECLEQKLLERENELVELQESFEEKEADTCQLFRQRQRRCDEEMEGLRQRCSTKLQHVSQMALKTHQALQLQVSTLQAEKERLLEDVSKLTREKELVELRMNAFEATSSRLTPTLEETQWEVCQKTGEISLLKQQLRECQADVSHKLNEIVSLKASLKERAAKIEMLEKQNKDHEDILRSRTIEIEVCQNELQRKKNEADFLREKVDKLEKDIQGLKQDLVTARMQHTLKQGGQSQSWAVEEQIQALDSPNQDNDAENGVHMCRESLQREVERLTEQLREEKNAQERLASSFEQERQTWNKEKDKVIKYQKQLQINYLQMHKKNRDLERVLKELTAELESRTTLGRDVTYSSGLQTYDDVIATEI
ncbi:leucine zipper putative tumor suppressor 1 isoform 2-T4 [Pholidichthys leucotaenia]